jgi:two-component system NtrC family sensor kinase
MDPHALFPFFAQAGALAALLLCSLLVYRVFPRRYLLTWICGWLFYLAHLSICSIAPAQAESLFSLFLLLAAQLFVAESVARASNGRDSLRLLLPVAAGAALGELLAFRWAPGARGGPASLGYLLLGLLACHWGIQRYRRREGAGASLLCIALFLRLVHPLHSAGGAAWLPALHALDAGSAVLALTAMLVLALEATRLHLRWSAASGVVASVAADQASPGRFGPAVVERIAQEIRRVFEASFSQVHLLEPQAFEPEAYQAGSADVGFLLASLPRSGAGPVLCTTVIGAERGPEAAEWLEQHGVHRAVVVPIPHSSGALPAGLFVVGYRHRRLVSTECMQALVSTGRQLGIVLENTRLLRQLSRAYREWVNTVDAIGDLVVVHDAAYRIQRTNKALAERLGYVPADLIQRQCSEAFPALAQRSWTHCPFCELAPGGDTYFEELRGYFLVSTSRYPREEPSGILHVVKDITDRRRAEEKYRTIFENVHEGVFISTFEGRFVDFNDAMARMLGYSREEMFAADIRSLYVEPADRGRLLREIQTKGYVSDYELRLRRKNGEVMIALETSFGTRDESGEIRQVQGFLLDITARKKAEEQLHKHVNMLSAVNELSERLTGSLQVEELLRAVVRDLARIFGFDTVSAYIAAPEESTAVRVASEGYQSELGGKTGHLTLTPEFREALRSGHRGIFRLSELPQTEEFRRLQEAEGLLSVYVTVIEGKHLLCGLAMGLRRKRTLTPAEENLLEAVARQLEAAIENAELYQQTRRAYEELRLAQEQLLQSEKMAAMGQLVSGVAHELNNPLTAIIGYSQLLGGYVTEKGAEYVEKMLHQARRTQRIIQNLLSFSRQHKPERRIAGLNRVIEDALVLREYELRMANVSIARHLSDSLPQVQVDVHQLEQVFLNIINNAYDAIREKHGPRGGTIEVCSYAEGDLVVAEFCDDGAGISDPARVFDPFYTTKSVGKGTGLGLSICYGIVKEHGGEITAGNRPAGGARFAVRLPAGLAAVSASPAS